MLAFAPAMNQQKLKKSRLASENRLAKDKQSPTTAAPPALVSTSPSSQNHVFVAFKCTNARDSDSWIGKCLGKLSGLS